MTDPRRQSSHHRARSVGNAARSRRLWTTRLCTFTRRRHLRKKHNKKTVTICTVIKNVESSRLNTYTYPHSFTPLPSKTSIPQRCSWDYTKETDISCQHSAAPRNNGAKPEGDVMTIRQTRHFRLWRRQNSRWRRRWPSQTGWVRALSCGFFFILSIAALALVYVVIMYTYRTTVLLWCSVLCVILVLFMYETCQWPWRIAPIIFNNVSLCPSIFIANIPGLHRPRVLTPGLMLASWMR